MRAGTVLVVVALLLIPSSTFAEPFVDLYVGRSLPQRANIDHRDPRGRTRIFGANFEDSLAFGGGFGWWANKFVGVGFDAFSFEPDVSAQRRRFRETDRAEFRDNQESLDFRVTVLALDVIGRYGFLTSADFPNGRAQVYAGAGPGFFITRMRDSTDLNPPRQSHTDDDVGAHAKTGAKFFVTRNWAIFASYAFTHHAPSSKFRDFPDTEVIRTTLDVHHVGGGISFHFGR